MPNELLVSIDIEYGYESFAWKTNLTKEELIKIYEKDGLPYPPDIPRKLGGFIAFLKAKRVDFGELFEGCTTDEEKTEKLQNTKFPHLRTEWLGAEDLEDYECDDEDDMDYPHETFVLHEHDVFVQDGTFSDNVMIISGKEYFRNGSSTSIFYTEVK